MVLFLAALPKEGNTKTVVVVIYMYTALEIWQQLETDNENLHRAYWPLKNPSFFGHKSALILMTFHFAAHWGTRKCITWFQTPNQYFFGSKKIRVYQEF